MGAGPVRPPTLGLQELSDPVALDGLVGERDAEARRVRQRDAPVDDLGLGRDELRPQGRGEELGWKASIHGALAVAAW